MAGRRESQKKEREARVLRAASVLFARRGFERTSMQDIARRSRLAVGTIYNYFRSKPEIILALVQRDTLAGLHAGEAVLKHPPRDPVAAVQDLLERAVEPFARHDRNLWRELTSAALKDPELTASFFAADVRLIALVAALLRELRARGDLREDLDPDRGAVCLYGIFFSWYMAHLTNEAISHEMLRAELRAGVALVMNGYLERAQGGSP
jgi:AcrR family transcriptional regulator